MKQYVNDRFPHMIHGGDYNPEQWIDDKSIWDKDMEAVKKLGLISPYSLLLAHSSIKNLPRGPLLHFLLTEKS